VQVDVESLRLALLVAAFVAPGLALVALEVLQGHLTELRGPVWAAAMLPAAIDVTFALGVRASTGQPPGVSWGAASPVDGSLVPGFGLGLVLTAVLVPLTLVATRRARRLRKPVLSDGEGPLSPPPAA
jgi:hypothetical protein